MTTTPRVSVIMAVYNGERYLRQAVESILVQTVADLELIVVNDASTDGSAEILASYADPRLCVFHNQHNLGPGPSRNIAIRAARAPFIAFQDADDTCAPSRLEKQLWFLCNHRSVAFVGCQGYRMDENGRTFSLIDLPLDDLHIKWRLLFGNVFIPQSLMIRRPALEAAGLYPEEGTAARLAEDYDLVSRLARRSGSANMAEPLYGYRANPCGACSRFPAELRRQVEYVSKRNICWILGLPAIAPELWRSVTKYLFALPKENINFEWREIVDVLTFLMSVQQVFYRTYHFPRLAAAEHKLKVRAAWARHAVALACKRNGRRSVGCRANLFISALKLLTGVIPASMAPVSPE